MCLIMTEDGWQNLGDGKVCSNHNKLEGVYRPMQIEDAQTELSLRAHAFCKLVEEGDIPAIKAFNPPLFGAFGEKL